MNKMQMAHDMALVMAANGDVPNGDIVAIVWQYADAMQVEADERTTRCDKKIEINMYPEWDASINYPPDAWVMYRGEKRLAISIKNEWQPDWNQAPEWAKAWTINRHGEGIFWSEIPAASHDGYFLKHENYKLKQGLCYLFGYTGNWQDSLRKRPQ